MRPVDQTNNLQPMAMQQEWVLSEHVAPGQPKKTCAWAIRMSLLSYCRTEGGACIPGAQSPGAAAHPRQCPSQRLRSLLPRKMGRSGFAGDAFTASSCPQSTGTISPDTKCRCQAWRRAVVAGRGPRTGGAAGSPGQDRAPLQAHSIRGFVLDLQVLLSSLGRLLSLPLRHVCLGVLCSMGGGHLRH